jgi:hypothetical protein
MLVAETDDWNAETENWYASKGKGKKKSKVAAKRAQYEEP